MEDDTGPVYRTLAEDGRLTARVVGALWWDRAGGDEQVAQMVQRRGDYSHGRFQATSIKLMQDGIVENFTAGMTDPYLDEHGAPTDEQRQVVHRARGPAALRDVAGRAEVPVPLPRHRRSRRPRGARRDRGRAARERVERPAAPRRAHPAHPS